MARERFEGQRFITPLPFKTLTRHPVVTGLYDEEADWQPTHIPLADEADMLLIAPATANVIAKLAHGLADDALTCIALALNPRAKLLIAPAMNGKMWRHPATQANVKILKARGAEFIGPDQGLLACGYEGIGRLWPVEKIAARVMKL
jgi:phosphopantothenoylcysteine synthetase/decarboxylase